MMKNIVGFVAAVALFTAAGAVLAGSRPAFVPAAYFPAAQIFAFNEGIGKLDTRTGEIFELRGNLDNASTQVSWFSRVRPVVRSSGTLQVQRADFNRPDAIVLVDLQTGDTWLLRARGNNNASWESISNGS